MTYQGNGDRHLVTVDNVQVAAIWGHSRPRSACAHLFIFELQKPGRIFAKIMGLLGFKSHYLEAKIATLNKCGYIRLSHQKLKIDICV